MNTAQWKEKFRKERLPKLLETEWDEWVEDGHFNRVKIKKKLAEEGVNYFTIESDNGGSTYLFDEHAVEIIQNALPDDWKIIDYLIEQGRNERRIVEVANEEEAVKLFVEDQERNGSRTGKQDFRVKLDIQTTSLSDVRAMVKHIKELEAPKADYARGSLVLLFSEDELVEQFGEAGRNLKTAMEDLNLSVRAWNGMKREGYHTVFDIAFGKANDLLEVHQLGGSAHREIVEKIEERKVPWELGKKIVI